jgi:hypothetical protein
LNDAISLNPMWNEPPIMLPATGVMSIDSCANMASLGGIDDEFATPVAEMTTPVSVSEITQCDQTLVSLHKAAGGDALESTFNLVSIE